MAYFILKGFSMYKIYKLSGYLNSKGLFAEAEMAKSIFKVAQPATLDPENSVLKYSVYNEIGDRHHQEVIAKAIKSTSTINKSIIRDFYGADRSVHGAPFGQQRGDNSHKGLDIKISNNKTWHSEEEDFLVYPAMSGTLNHATGSNAGNYVKIYHGTRKYKAENKDGETEVFSFKFRTNYMHMKSREHIGVRPTSSSDPNKDKVGYEIVRLKNHIESELSSPSKIYFRLGENGYVGRDDLLGGLKLGLDKSNGEEDIKEPSIDKENFAKLLSAIQSSNINNPNWDDTAKQGLENFNSLGNFELSKKMFLAYDSASGLYRNIFVKYPVGSRPPPALDLENIAPNAGDSVLVTDPIGFVGSSGRSDGPHVHFEVIAYDIKRERDGKVIKEGSVYIDPALILN